MEFKDLINKPIKSIKDEYGELVITYFSGDVFRAYVMHQGDTGLTYTLNGEPIKKIFDEN